MRIGFFAPANYNDPTIRYSGPSLGISYIAAHLKQRFPEIQEIFLELDAERLIQRQPDMVGISAFTYAYGQAKSGARQIRAALGPQVPILLGGPHISSLPENLDSSMDLGVIGEGELVMEELVSAWLQGDWQASRFRRVPGLVFWNERGQLERSSCSQRIPELDALPLPDRAIMSAWWPESNEEIRWMPTLLTSRGCPFTCGFCMYSKTANLVRYHSVDRVIADIEDILIRFPTLSHIRITDDLFVTRKARLKEIADRIRAEKLHTRVTFGCMAKASFFDEEFARILKSMNIAVMSFGFESGSDPVLHYLKDKKSSVAKNQQALDICRKYGIHIGGYFIIGAPPETRSDLARTWWFIERNTPIMPIAGIFPLTATPGTAVWAETEARGLIGPDFEDWDRLNYNALEKGQYLHLNPHYSAEELNQIHQLKFAGIKRRSSFHLIAQSLFRTLQMFYYQQRVYPALRGMIASDQRILEIHRGDLALQHLLEQDYQLDSRFWTEVPTDLSGYDIILLSHTLEKLGFQSETWRRICATGKPVILIVENFATWTQLYSLLKGREISGYNLEQTLGWYRYSRKTLEKGLKQSGYQVSALVRHNLPDVQSELIQSLIAPFAGIQFPPESDFMSYPLLLHIFKGFSDPETLNQLKALLPSQPMIQDAETFSFTLAARKTEYSLVSERQAPRMGA